MGEEMMRRNWHYFKRIVVMIIMKISYYAIIQNDEDGMWVKFPDLEGCFSCGNEDNIEQMAKEAMELYLHNMDVDGIPAPSSVSDFILVKNQTAAKITINVEVMKNRIYCDIEEGKKI